MAPATDRGGGRIPQDVTDVSSPDQLLRYALAGQLERALALRGLTQGVIGRAAGLGATSRTAGPAMSMALRRGPSLAQLRGLDEILGVLAPDRNSAGSLWSLALRLSASRRGDSALTRLTARVPSTWNRGILRHPPVGEAGVLLQASALLSEFVAADRLGAAGTRAGVHDRYRAETELLVRRLIQISAAPPTATSQDAQILLGMLASYSFESMRDQLESQLRFSPLGFRVWPAITRLVQLGADGRHADALRVWVRHLVTDFEGLRQVSAYPGSGLDLELAITVPAAWSPPGDDWVGAALRARALSSEATVSERAWAAHGLWQRAMIEARPDVRETEADLRSLIREFTDPASRPDAATGLRWLGATLEHVIDRRVAVCNEWPAVDEPWFVRVQQIADDLDHSGIPDNLLTGAKSLFRHMILQNAGLYRSQALETVVASGWTEPFARTLGVLLREETGEAWLRSRAEFALGLLRHPDMFTEADLTTACEHAYASLRLDAVPDEVAPPRSPLAELHSALFAVGDCFGATGAEDLARSARDRLRPILQKLADMAADSRQQAMILRRPARAAAYLLMVTAQPRTSDKKDLSQELLERLSSHPDEVTARLSTWALSFRFAPDGAVRPILKSAEYGTFNGS